MTCDGCNVQPPWEHRCHGEPCSCPECYPKLCPICCATVIEKGLAAAGEICAGCRFSEQRVQALGR